MEFYITTEFRAFLIVAMVYLMTIPDALTQSVIDEDFLYTENCARSSSTSKGKVVLDNINLIMDELHKQNHENMLLKQEVEDLRSKYEEQRFLFSQLNELMQALLHKVKLGQTSCPCDVKSATSTTKESTSVSNISIESPPPGQTTTKNPSPSAPDHQPSTVPSPVIADVPTTTGEQTTYSIERVDVSAKSDIGAQDGALGRVTSEKTSTSTRSPRIVHEAVYPRDCQDLLSSRSIFDGRYRIQPVNSSQPFHAYCQLENDTAWTVIQRRSNGNVDFFRNWTDYRNGFGEPDGEFWIGNEQIHQLTKQSSYKLRIDMWDWSGNYYYAESSKIYIGNETEYYRLHSPDDYYAYSGFAGSGLRVHRGPFMTFDNQDPSMISDNCAQKFHCGWWFTTCVRNANLNGKYYEGGYEDLKKRTRNLDDVYWHNIHESLKQVQMKLLRTKSLEDGNKK